MKMIRKTGVLLLLTGILHMPAIGYHLTYGKQVRGMITSTDPAGRTVLIGSTGTYLISNNAQILVNGRHSPLNALTSGMATTLYLNPRGSNAIKVMARQLSDGEVFTPGIFIPRDRDRDYGYTKKINGIVTGTTSNSISIDEKGSRPPRTVGVANDADIKVNGVRGSLYDVRAGMKASVSLNQNRDVAVKIQANTYNAQPGERGNGKKGKGHDDKAAKWDKADKNEGLGRRSIPGIVVRVSASTITLDQHGSGPVRMIRVADNADIRVNGTTAHLWDIREGMKATVILDYSRDVAVKIQANAHASSNTGKAKPNEDDEEENDKRRGENGKGHGRGKGHEKDRDRDGEDD